MPKTVTILGVNGRLGQNAAQAFATAGWQVFGFGRTDRVAIPGVTFLAGDAENPEDIARAVAPADLVLDAVNLPYDKWDRGRYEKSLSARLKGLSGSGKTLLFPGNIYNFSADAHVLTPETPEHPATDKGVIRIRLEQMLKDASERDNLKVIILRAPDFFGPGMTGTVFDLFMLKNLKHDQILYPGNPALGHSWAYLPDLARAFVRLAEERDNLAQFDRLHFAGHFLTGIAFQAAAERALGRPLTLRQVNWLPYRLIAPVIPIVREVLKMNYLWDTPHRLADPRLDQLLGPDFLTPFDDALSATLSSYLPTMAGKNDARTAHT